MLKQLQRFMFFFNEMVFSFVVAGAAIADQSHMYGNIWLKYVQIGWEKTERHFKKIYIFVLSDSTKVIWRVKQKNRKWGIRTDIEFDK